MFSTIFARTMTGGLPRAAARSCAKRIQSGVERGSPLSLANGGAASNFLRTARARAAGAWKAVRSSWARLARETLNDWPRPPVAAAQGTAALYTLEREMAYVPTPN